MKTGKRLEALDRIYEAIREYKTVAVFNKKGRTEFIPLVRCKDCKYYRKNPVIPCTHVLRPEDVDENWFCADGKRR